MPASPSSRCVSSARRRDRRCRRRPGCPTRPDDEPVTLDELLRVDGWGRSEPVRALARTLYDPVYRHWLRAEWEGLEHVPLEGGALLVANHGGAIPSDAPVVMHGIETELLRPVYGLAENLFRQLPVLGTLWSRAGGVPAHPDNAYRLLHDDGQLVLVFPEGTKATGKLVRDRYQLRRFGRGGFVEIAMRAGVPIVPMAIVGNEEAMPILWKSARIAKAARAPLLPDHRQPVRVRTAARLRAAAAGEVPHPGAAADHLRRRARSRPLQPRHGDGAGRADPRRSSSREVDDLLRNRRSVWRG